MSTEEIWNKVESIRYRGDFIKRHKGWSYYMACFGMYSKDVIISPDGEKRSFNQ
jgi:hypothetical protein